VDEVAFSPDGTLVATRSDSSSARVFDAHGTEVYSFEHDGLVYALAFSRDGALIATGSGSRSGGKARMFDAATGIEVSRLDLGGFVFGVAFSSDGTRLATSDTDEGVQIWSIKKSHLVEQATQRLTRNLTEHEWRRYFRNQPYHKIRADLP
jgi:WD40 repeat protein